ncbi:MAG: Ca-activated chloride channel family protein [Planctomycetota bacterium]|jgi:Ca-activated chloride channel family protein
MEQSNSAKGWSDDPRVLAYALGELGPDDRAVIDRALASGDEALRAELRDLEAFLPMLEPSVVAEPAVLGDAARDAIVQAASARRPRPRSHWPRTFAAAAMVLAGVGVWVHLGVRDGAAESQGYFMGESRRAAWRPVVTPTYTGEMVIKEVRPTPENLLRGMGYMGYGEDATGDLLEVRDWADSGFVKTQDDALSTFAIDVDTASYARARSLIQDGRRPMSHEVRVEEFINYFAYGDEAPRSGTAHPLAVTAQVAAAPWNPSHRLVRIGLAAERIEFQEREPANLVFLVDVSGSMSSAGKLPLVVKALALLTESLAPNDRIAIVVYAGSKGLALDSTPVAAREAILQALESMASGGSTNGGAGIQLAYSVARSHFVESGVNRVILCTDGDFNVGVTSESALLELIAEEAAGGVDLTVLGFGDGNYRDDKMEALSNRGNGNFAYIDSMIEARKVLASEVGGTLVTVARDTKIQVAWDPQFVESFRQIGYENRQLAHADFEDDSVDAGEVGAGHVVSALYEVVPVPGVNLAAADAIGEVRVRYQPPSGGASRLLTAPVRDGGATFDEGAESLRFSSAVAAFGMILRDSSYVGEATLQDVRRWALEALGADPGGLRAAFVGLVERVDELAGR